ncbi:uncharacterized protein LOC118736488 isoform X2 [Rhagoletis pomonella]|uniref:uncharacterized protein LOC118736488 isoform X2 n=1 Tax=Rhagoletis pomonella TaxID=28610 RepID=UPI001783E3BE|nr:uncharacterized protein LOC118736488 isoform X2 [Rhagoletis pomonella]
MPLTIVKSAGGFTYDISHMLEFVSGQSTHLQNIYSSAERACIFDSDFMGLLRRTTELQLVGQWLKWYYRWQLATESWQLMALSIGNPTEVPFPSIIDP